MGVYIKGMEMPKERPQLLWIYPDGKVITVKSDVDPEDNFNAVPVPPHGRLVDAEKLTEEMRLFIKENMLSRDDARELIETIAEAPTIIEAEGEER